MYHIDSKGDTNVIHKKPRQIRCFKTYVSHVSHVSHNFRIVLCARGHIFVGKTGMCVFSRIGTIYFSVIHVIHFIFTPRKAAKHLAFLCIT